MSELQLFGMFLIGWVAVVFGGFLGFAKKKMTDKELKFNYWELIQNIGTGFVGGAVALIQGNYSGMTFGVVAILTAALSGLGADFTLKKTILP
jgi:hypothetical protein